MVDTNLVPNYSFEAQYDQWTTRSEWIQSPPDCVGSGFMAFEIDPALAHEGTRSARLGIDSAPVTACGVFGWSTGRIPIQANRPHHFSMWTQTDHARGPDEQDGLIRVEIAQFDAGGKRLSALGQGTVDPLVNAWSELAFDMLPPQLATGTQQIIDPLAVTTQITITYSTRYFRPERGAFLWIDHVVFGPSGPAWIPTPTPTLTPVPTTPPPPPPPVELPATGSVPAEPWAMLVIPGSLLALSGLGLRRLRAVLGRRRRPNGSHC
jgi:hypothetical protein